jgi:hypothetical protein
VDCLDAFEGVEYEAGLKWLTAGWLRRDPVLTLAWRGREGGQLGRKRF